MKRIWKNFSGRVLVVLVLALLTGVALAGAGISLQSNVQNWVGELLFLSPLCAVTALFVVALFFMPSAAGATLPDEYSSDDQYDSVKHMRDVRETNWFLSGDPNFSIGTDSHSTDRF